MSKIIIKYQDEKEWIDHIGKIQAVYKITKISRPKKGEKYFQRTIDVMI